MPNVRSHDAPGQGSRCQPRTAYLRLVLEALQEGIARLILLNGPPGVGKSAVARRYLDDHHISLPVTTP